MRRLIWTFVILSPLIAVAQSSQLPVLTHSGTQLAHAVATTASTKMADVVHAVQALLT